jgi:hypothetical protein
MTMNQKFGIALVAAGLSVITIGGLAPAARAQRPATPEARQKDKNLMRNLGIGLGALAAQQAAKGSTTSALVLGAGAAYAGKKYEDARKAQSRDDDRRLGRYDGRYNDRRYNDRYDNSRYDQDRYGRRDEPERIDGSRYDDARYQDRDAYRDRYDERGYNAVRFSETRAANSATSSRRTWQKQKKATGAANPFRCPTTTKAAE